MNNIESFIKNRDAKDRARLTKQLVPKLQEIYKAKEDGKTIELIYDEKLKPIYKLKEKENDRFCISYQKINKTEYLFMKHIGFPYKEQDAPLEIENVLEMTDEEIKKCDKKEIKRLLYDNAIPFRDRVHLNIKIKRIGIIYE